MRLFLLARHGQSLFNVDKVVNGDPVLDRGLSEQGIEEAERLAGQLAALPLELVAVSPFPRALQTANIALGSREVPHLVDDDLGDVRIGELEGESLDAYRAAPAHSNPAERFPGGESLDEAARRYAGAFAPLPPAGRASFEGLDYWPYDPEARVLAELEDVEAPAEPIESSGPEPILFKPFARAHFELRGEPLVLEVDWLEGYGGGAFLSFRDATGGRETYGGGRYILDTVKGAEYGEAGGTTMVDVNFTPDPSCSFH